MNDSCGRVESAIIGAAGRRLVAGHSVLAPLKQGIRGSSMVRAMVMRAYVTRHARHLEPHRVRGDEDEHQ